MTRGRLVNARIAEEHTVCHRERRKTLNVSFISAFDAIYIHEVIYRVGADTDLICDCSLNCREIRTIGKNPSMRLLDCQ